MFAALPSLMSLPFLQATVGLWLVFAVVVAGLMTFDLGVLNRKDHEIGIKESLWLTLAYFIVALLFGGWVWGQLGATQGFRFFTAYLVEQSLSLDNLFVMSLIFASFGIPRQYQHRVLFWGIIGVILMRGILIGLGAAMVHHFDKVLLLFAAFLIYTGVKLIIAEDDDDVDVEDSKFLKLIRRYIRVTPFLHGNDFFTKQSLGGKRSWTATPLFVALLTIEIADLIFAVDSVPAVLGITTHTFVVFSSNIFAVIGLRAMYFAVAAIIHRFEYMKFSLSAILVFIGLKAIYNYLPYPDISPLVSLLITLATLGAGIVFSLIKTRNMPQTEPVKPAFQFPPRDHP